MRRIGLFLVIALVAASCSGGGAETTTTSSTEATTTTSTTTTSTTTTTTVPETTTTTLPPSPVIAREGDKTTVAAAVQFLLECLGYGDLTLDGNYGPATTTAVETAQSALGMAVTGDADENLFAALSISCPEDPPITLDDEEPTTVIGYATAGSPVRIPLALLFGSTLNVTPKTGEGAIILVKDAEGNPLESEDGVTFPITATADYVVDVSTEADPVVFTLDLFVDAGAGAGDWIITTDGIAYKGTKFTLSTPAGPMITKIFEFLGHNVRSSFGEFDTGWDDPTQEGFRGIFIEGLAFLFYGPTAANPGIPETFGRVRYVGPSYDKDGNPRPAGWVQTLSGITVGNTLAELQATYGSVLKAGSDSVGHYYRYPAANGDEVCFYFGKTAPTATSKIVEIGTECRGT